MSDLISREELLKEEATIKGYSSLRFVMVDDIKSAPSADIMECARALKEHCNEHLRKPYSLCDDCPMFERVCRKFNVVPRRWDLPEGEKGGE